MSKHNKIVYIEGYEHYSHKRNIQIHFVLNEAEYHAFQDLMAVLGENNQSTFIRHQIFKPYDALSPAQKEKLAEIRAWRLSEDNPSHKPQKD